MSSKGCLAQARNWPKKIKEYIYICMQTKGLVKCFSELGNIFLEAFPFNEIVLGGESHNYNVFCEQPLTLYCTSSYL